MKNATPNIRYFNVHTEGFGYLNGFKQVTPKAGQTFKPFFASTLCMLEGDPQKPRHTYMSVSIVNPVLIDLLQHYAGQLNSDATKVFVNARVADVKAIPFIYPQGSNNAGKPGVNWEAKIINLLYLKVGDQVVELERNATTDLGVPAAQRDQPSPVPSTPLHPKFGQLFDLFEKPLVVELSKDDPYFEENKERLKSDGYRWNKEHTAWVLGEVKLTKDDPHFQDKYTVLKANGYAFSKETQSWIIPSPKPQGQSQGNYRNQGQPSGNHQHRTSA
jgi:hypothetical protein